MTAFLVMTKRLLKEFGPSLTTLGLAMAALDIQQNPKKLTTRILILSICFTGMFFYWSYNATLTSFLTVVSCPPIHTNLVLSSSECIFQEKIEIPINQMKDLLEKTNYQVFVRSGTSHESYFSEADVKHDKDAWKVWTETMKGRPEAFFEDDDEAENILTENDHKVFFSQELSTEYAIKLYPCDLVKSTNVYNTL